MQCGGLVPRSATTTTNIDILASRVTLNEVGTLNSINAARLDYAAADGKKGILQTPLPRVMELQMTAEQIPTIRIKFVRPELLLKEL